MFLLYFPWIFPQNMLVGNWIHAEKCCVAMSNVGARPQVLFLIRGLILIRTMFENVINFWILLSPFSLLPWGNAWRPPPDVSSLILVFPTSTMVSQLNYIQSKLQNAMFSWSNCCIAISSELKYSFQESWGGVVHETWKLNKLHISGKAKI